MHVNQILTTYQHQQRTVVVLQLRIVGRVASAQTELLEHGLEVLLALLLGGPGRRLGIERSGGEVRVHDGHGRVVVGEGLRRGEEGVCWSTFVRRRGIICVLLCDTLRTTPNTPLTPPLRLRRRMMGCSLEAMMRKAPDSTSTVRAKSRMAVRPCSASPMSAEPAST